MSLCVVKEQSQYNHQNRGHMQSGDPAEDRVTILAKHGKISSDDISRVSLYGRGPSSGAGHFVSDPNLIQIRGLRTILSITSKKQLPKYRPTPSTELRAPLIGHASNHISFRQEGGGKKFPKFPHIWFTFRKDKKNLSSPFSEKGGGQT